MAAAVLIPAAVMTHAGTMEAAAPAVTYTQVDEGSATTHRPNTDNDSGEVYIYVGGSFPTGTHPAAFRYLFDFTEEGNTTGYITPLLFEYTSVGSFTVYTVVGIGKGFEVTLNSAPQTIPFEVIQGTKVTTAGNFTFGYINATVNSSGVPVLTSPGTVDFNLSAQGGERIGGAGTTNVWEVTASIPPPSVVTLGTTFGDFGASVDYNIQYSRTYSAIAIGLVAAQ